MFNTLSIILGVVATLALMVGFIPLLGWTIWFLVLPAAFAGLVLGVISRDRGGQTINIAVLVVAGLRLLLGGGVI